MARRDPIPVRHNPPVRVIGHPPDLFGGPTIEHQAERQPIPKTWGRDLLRLMRTLADRAEA